MRVCEMMEYAEAQHKVMCPWLQLGENHLDVGFAIRHLEIWMLVRESKRKGDVRGQIFDAGDLMAVRREGEAEVTLRRAEVENAQRATKMNAERCGSAADHLHSV